jgi:cytochrome c peroxidase
MRKLIGSALWTVALALTACRSGGGSSPEFSSGSGGYASDGSSLSPSTATLSLAAQVGRQIFFDKTLSGSGKMSCATCHDPGFAYGPPNSLAVQLGGGPTCSLLVRARCRRCVTKTPRLRIRIWQSIRTA